MREIRTSGSEGGARFYPLSLPYRRPFHSPWATDAARLLD